MERGPNAQTGNFFFLPCRASHHFFGDAMDVDTQRPQGYAGVPQRYDGVQLCGPVKVGAEVQMDSQGKHCSMPFELTKRHARSASSSNNSICVAHGEDGVN